MTLSGSKVCCTCRVCQPLEDFHKNKNTPDGLSGRCKLCAKAAATEYASRNKELILLNKSLRRSDARYSMYESAKQRAKTGGLPFDLTKDDIEIPDTCPALGIPLAKGNGKLTANSPSLDRIIPELGYVKGNVQVISYKANVMKTNATKEELLAFAGWVRRMFGQSLQKTI